MAKDVGDEVEWDAAWLDELDRRARSTASDPAQVEDWQLVRERLLAELRLKT